MKEYIKKYGVRVGVIVASVALIIGQRKRVQHDLEEGCPNERKS